MDKDILHIFYNKETSFEFDLAVTGLSIAAATVRFGLEVPGLFTFIIPCVRGDDGKWNVTIPSLAKHMDEGMFAFFIELMIDGYYFEPIRGTANVSPAMEASASMPTKPVEVSVTSITPKASNDDTPSSDSKSTGRITIKPIGVEEKKPTTSVGESLFKGLRQH